MFIMSGMKANMLTINSCQMLGKIIKGRLNLRKSNLGTRKSKDVRVLYFYK